MGRATVSVLEVRGLTVRFGPVAAVTDVDLDLAAGTVTGLIGPNGAGKTTVIDALTGFVPVASGRISLDGRAVERLPAHARARLGLGRTFQSLELFEDLTVGENLLVAAEAAGGGAEWAAGWAAWAGPPTCCRRSCPTPSGGWWPSPGPSPAARRCCCSTSPRPASTPPAARPSAAGCGGWPTTGRPCSSSTTTSTSSSTCATRSPSSTGAG